jgi:hypothetical protein
MQKGKAKSKTWKIIRWVGAGISLIAWAWSIWPAENVQSVLSFSEPSGINETDNDCENWVQLKKSAIKLSYPQSIRYKEQGFVILTIDPGQSFYKEREEDCTVVLEAYLGMSDVDIKPGARIFEPLSTSQTQMIIFQITADRKTENIKGNLWIHAIVTDNRQTTKSEQRNPLFVIPLKIGLIYFLGIPFPYLRIAFMGLALALIFGKVIMRWLK